MTTKSPKPVTSYEIHTVSRVGTIARPPVVRPGFSTQPEALQTFTAFQRVLRSVATSTTINNFPEVSTRYQNYVVKVETTTLEDGTVNVRTVSRTRIH